MFWILALPGTFWLVVFFLIPLGIIWFMSFGEKAGLIDINITGTLANYVRTTEAVYLQIFWKSIWISALATALVPADGLSDRFRHLFRPAKMAAL